MRNELEKRVDDLMGWICFFYAIHLAVTGHPYGCAACLLQAFFFSIGTKLRDMKSKEKSDV